MYSQRLYIPCVEFQFCIQLPFEKKMANLISKGGGELDSGKGGVMPEPIIIPKLCPIFLFPHASTESKETST